MGHKSIFIQVFIRFESICLTRVVVYTQQGWYTGVNDGVSYLFHIHNLGVVKCVTL